MNRKSSSTVWAILAVVVLFVGILYAVDSAFKVPVVEKSYTTDVIRRITIDGKEVPRSQYKQILAGSYEIKHVK